MRVKILATSSYSYSYSSTSSDSDTDSKGSRSKEKEGPAATPVLPTTMSNRASDSEMEPRFEPESLRLQRQKQQQQRTAKTADDMGVDEPAGREPDKLRSASPITVRAESVRGDDLGDDDKRSAAAEEKEKRKAPRNRGSLKLLEPVYSRGPT